MTTWVRKPQEKEGNYFFSGQFYVTRRVAGELQVEEILSIYQDVQAFVREQNGIDYLQVYIDENGRKLFFIDNLDKDMVANGQYRPEDNYCTLMFASEY